MNKVVLFTLSFLFISNLLTAQCETSEPGNVCLDAPICCDIGLDGFMSTLPEPANFTVDFPGCNAGIINNPHYLKFVAGSEFIELNIIPTNCIEFNGSTGMQAAVYAECLEVNGPVISIPETPVAVNCGNNTETFSLTGIYEIGQTYYLLLDGLGGAICDYEIEVLEGSTISPELESISPVLTAPSFVLNNMTYDFSVDPIVGVVDYDWTVTGGEILTSSGNEISVLVNDDANFQVCVEGVNDCSQTLTSCADLGPNPYEEIIEAEVCEGECFEFNNTLFCQEGTYEVEVENGNSTDLYLIIITENQLIEISVEEHICFGDCYEFNNLNLCESGVYTASLVSSAGCDSIVTLTLTVLESDEPVVTAFNSGDLDCQNLTSTLTAFSSVPGATFLWSGPGITPDNENDQIIEVEVGGVYTVIGTTSSGCSNIATTHLLGEPQAPEIIISGNDPFNCNNDENTITVSSAISNIFYEWSGPGGFSETGPEITVNLLGEYVLIFTTASGCMDTLIVNVEENDEPLFVDPGPNRHIQCEFILDLEAPGAMGTNIVYEWTTLDGNILFGENTLNPRVNRNGTYTLTATDLSNGCQGSADMIVYADMAIIESSFYSLTCDEPTVQIDGSESYNGNDAEFFWTTNDGNIISGGNTLTPTVDAGGVYQLLINRPGCLSFATTTVLDFSFPPDIEIIPSSSDIFCGAAVILFGNTNTSTPEYTWTLDGVIVSTNETHVTNTPGEYILTVENTSTGCTNTTSYVLNEIQDPQSVSINGDLTLDCTLNGTGQLNAEVMGADPAYDFEWTTIGGEILNGGDSDAITILGGGTYCLEVFSLNSSCSILHCVDVEEISDIVLEPTLTNPSCESSNDGSIELFIEGGTAPYVFEWIGPNGATYTSQNIYDLAPGNYSVTVTDAIACQAFQSFIIEEGNNEAVSADAGADQSFDCSTNFIVLDAGASVFPPGSSFSWLTSNGTIDDGANTLFPSVSSTGTYIIIITSPDGCQDSDEVVVVDYEAEAGATQTLDCNNSTIDLAGGNPSTGATYSWTTNDGNIIDGANTLNPTVDQAGTYTLLVTSSAGCTYTDETTVDTDFTVPNVSVVNAEIAMENCFEPVLLEGESTTNGVTYAWSGPGGTSSNANFSVEVEGVYTLVVTAPNGCTATTSIEVRDETFAPVITTSNQTQYLNCFNGNPLLLDVEIETLNNDVTLNWETLDGNIVELIGNSVSVDQAGTYQITVTDNGNNCFSEYTISVVATDAEIQVESTIANCGIPDATATVNTEFIHEPTFLWSTGETTASISGLAPEIYSVTISSPQSTCDEVRTVEVVQDPSCFVIISGYIYDDEDLTCSLNGNIVPKEGVRVTITPEDLETFTDAEGYYEFLVPPGDYSVEPQLISPYVVECPAESINVSVPAGSSGSEDNNFFVKALRGFDLYVTASSGTANAGANQFYQVTYCNNAFTTIFGTVEFTHDPLLTFDPVAAGADSYDPDTYTAVWNFVDLSFFECEFFNFQTFIPEDVPDGTVITSTVIVMPTQGDISPANNSTTWTRVVNNSSNTSFVNPEQETIEIHDQDLLNSEALISEIKHFPNPFSNQTNIEFVLQIEEEVELQLFDANGKLLKIYTGFEKGFNSLNISGNEFPAKGIYFYKIVGSSILESGRMIKH